MRARTLRVTPARHIVKPRAMRDYPALGSRAPVVGARGTPGKGGARQNVRKQSEQGAQSLVGVLIVDDQPLFRRVARDLVVATDGFEAVGEAADGRGALELADETSPDLVLVDVRMPQMNGIETARLLHLAHPEAAIVLISTDDADQLPPDIESCGAAEFVRKEALCSTTLRRLWAAHGPRG